MQSRDTCLVVLVTAPHEEEAEKLARILVEKRLAACANLVPRMRSFFWWEGKIDEQHEVLLLLKTTQAVLRELIETVQAHHSYQVPEIVALPIVEGSQKYLNWLAAETQSR
jgi:periplasmic divalent cation tolerance protein